MCSICGIIDFENSGNLKLKILQNMNSTMKSRGPDDSGFLSCNFAAFAHNRLSVMDIERGKQPMTRTVDGNRYTIIYNGEIACVVFDGEVVIRRFYYDEELDLNILQADNPDYPPVIIPGDKDDDLFLVGKIIYVLAEVK